MATAKQEEIKVRVTESMKARVVALAEERGESESVIVREALNAYLLRDDAAGHNAEPAPKPAKKTVDYRESLSKPKGESSVTTLRPVPVRRAKSAAVIIPLETVLPLHHRPHTDRRPRVE